jgi:hypothetical protein
MLFNNLRIMCLEEVVNELDSEIMSVRGHLTQKSIINEMFE